MRQGEGDCPRQGARTAEAAGRVANAACGASRVPVKNKEAEREGFEPSVHLRAYRFSSLTHSAARTRKTRHFGDPDRSCGGAHTPAHTPTPRPVSRPPGAALDCG